MRKRISIGAVVMVVLSFSLSVLLVEVFLRTTHFMGARVSWTVPDPKIGWRYKANFDYWYDSRENDRPTIGRTNNHAWNDRDRTLMKPPGTYRVAVLGDSYVEGLQVEQNRNFTALAEGILNRDGKLAERAFEVMNFGRSGFTQTEELLVLENEVLEFGPDLVVLFFFAPNDIMDVHPDTTWEPMRPFPLTGDEGELRIDTSFSESGAYRSKTLLAPIKNNSAFLSLLGERLRIFLTTRALREAATREGQPGHGEQRELAPYLSLATDSPNAAYSRNYEINKALIAAMQERSIENGADFLLVAIDTPDYVPEAEALLMSIDAGYDSRFFSRDLAAFSADRGLAFLDLQGVFRDHYRQNRVSLHFTPRKAWSEGNIPINFGHEGHWNYAGHEVVARALASKIRAIKDSSETL